MSKERRPLEAAAPNEAEEEAQTNPHQQDVQIPEHREDRNKTSRSRSSEKESTSNKKRPEAATHTRTDTSKEKTQKKKAQQSHPQKKKRSPRNTEPCNHQRAANRTCLFITLTVWYALLSTNQAASLPEHYPTGSTSTAYTHGQADLPKQTDLLQCSKCSPPKTPQHEPPTWKKSRTYDHLLNAHQLPRAGHTNTPHTRPTFAVNKEGASHTTHTLANNAYKSEPDRNRYSLTHNQGPQIHTKPIQNTTQKNTQRPPHTNLLHKECIPLLKHAHTHTCNRHPHAEYLQPNITETPAQKIHHKPPVPINTETQAQRHQHKTIEFPNRGTHNTADPSPPSHEIPLPNNTEALAPADTYHHPNKLPNSPHNPTQSHIIPLQP